MSEGFSLLIDNTTLHRLGFALNRPDAALRPEEVGNVLHLLECLVLASELTVNGFESAASQQRSDKVLDWLGRSEVGGIVAVSEQSDRATQTAIASSVAREMFDRGLLVPATEGQGDVGEVDVILGRPHGVVEIAGAFWDGVSSDMGNIEAVRERADHAVDTYRTDGLFVYGIAQHGDIVERLSHVYAKGDQPTADGWKHLHVTFRSLFNQQFADRHDLRSYAPPPVRARVLRVVYLQTLVQLRAVLSDVAFGLHTGLNNHEFAEDLIEGAPSPLPLLGLAYLLHADGIVGASATFEQRLACARELAAPLRSGLSALEDLARSDPAKYLRTLQADAESLDQIARSQLGLSNSQGLGMEVDFGVSVNPQTGATSVDVGLGGPLSKTFGEVRNKLPGRRRRVSVLSDGLARTVGYRTVEQAVRRVTR